MCHVMCLGENYNPFRCERKVCVSVNACECMCANFMIYYLRILYIYDKYVQYIPLSSHINLYLFA